MTNTHEDWLRVAQHVVDRRAALGLRQADLAAAAGVSVASIQDVESGMKTRYRPTTLGGIERGLRWQPGSIRTVLAGGEPTPLDEAPPAVPEVKRFQVGPGEELHTVPGFGDLSPEDQAAFRRQVAALAEQERRRNAH